MVTGFFIKKNLKIVYFLTIITAILFFNARAVLAADNSTPAESANYVNLEGMVKPDLVIESVNLDFAKPEIKIIVRNIGRVTINDPAVLRDISVNYIWIKNQNSGIGGDSSYNTNTNPLGPGGTLEFIFNDAVKIAPPEDATKIWFSVGVNTLDEADLGNNLLDVQPAPKVSSTITNPDVVAKPDLIVDSVNLNLVKPEIKIIVRNIGLAAITKQTDLRGIYVHYEWDTSQVTRDTQGENIQNTNFNPLVPGGTIELISNNAAKIAPSEDATNFRVNVGANSVEEADRRNINNYWDIRPAPTASGIYTNKVTKPDLAIRSVDIDYVKPEIKIIVQNIGLGTIDPADLGTLPEIYMNYAWFASNLDTEAKSEFIYQRINSPILPGETLEFISNNTDKITPPERATYLHFNVGSQSLDEADIANNYFFIVYANPNTTEEELVNSDTALALNEIQKERPSFDQAKSGPSDLADKQAKVGVLPDNPLYFLKDSGRSVRSFFTFNPQARAKLQLGYSRDKILEVNALMDKGRIDKAIKHLTSYQQELTKVKSSIDKFRNKDQEVAARADELLLANGLRHQTIFVKFYNQADANQRKELKNARDKIISLIAETANNLDDKAVMSAVGKGLKNIGSPYRLLGNAEILGKLAGATTEQTKIIIDRDRNYALSAFLRSNNNLPPEYRDLISKFTSKAVFYQAEVNDSTKLESKMNTNIINPALKSPVKNNTAAEGKNTVKTPSDSSDSSNQSNMSAENLFGPTGLPGGSGKGPTGICPDDYDPVCGSDGKTYTNSCVLQMSNVWMDKVGPCLTGAAQ